MSLIDVLSEIGYKLSSHGYYYTTNGLYRQGQDPTSLTIYPDKNLVIDWVTGEKFNIEKLIALTLKTSPDQIKEWLQNKNVNIAKVEEEPKLEEPQILPIEWLDYLKPDHSYWLNRGISEEVIKEFRGGIATEQIPRMKGRYCLGVLNSKNQLVGLQGRSLDGKNPKYKILGSKSSFMFPIHLNLKDIKNKSEVILIEGVGCCLSGFEAGVRNMMVLFGVSLSNYQLSTLIAINPKKIVISLNQDNAGNKAAEKLRRRLWKFFDKRQVEIKPPRLKDLNEMLVKTGVNSIKEMYAGN